MRKESEVRASGGGAGRQGPSAAGVAAVAVAIVFSAQACGSSKSSSSPTAVGGRVTDSTGAVLAGVAVSAGTASATTGADGTYVLDVSPQANLVVAFSKSGYLPSSKPVDAAAGKTSNVAAALMPVAAPLPLDATAGGTVAGTRGSSLTMAPAALVDANGAPVSGMVQVSLTPFDPSVRGELAAYPGSLVGSTNGGTASLLHTYGVLDVTVTQNGQPVQVAPGQTATVTIPVAPSSNLPPTQDLWSFNMATGIWDHEGTAQLASTGDAYTAQLAHFSYHNIDAQIVTGQATCVTGLVVDATGKPISGAYVSPNLGASTDGLITTDSNGRYCTWLLTGQSDTITGDSTAAPFGEGSVTVTGGAPVAFPGSYTCDNLNCTTAPNIVLSQPPCTTDADCAGGGSCCTVAGQSHAMCVGDSYVCNEWETTPSSPGSTGSLSGCKSDSDCTNGNVCCSISGIAAQCLPSQTCSSVNAPPDSGSPTTGCTAKQNNGSVTAVINGETYTFDCFTGFIGGSEGDEVFAIQAAGSTGSLEITLESHDNFAAFTSGTQVSLDMGDGGMGDGGDDLVSKALIVTETDSNGDVVDAPSASGTLTLDTWSNTSGGTVSFTIASGTLLSGYVITMTGETPVTGTIGGTGTVVLYGTP
jgi:hypothetical protein